MSARHRQHKRKLDEARAELAEREVDLVSYDRVLADMRCRGLSPFGGAQALAIVQIFRDAIAHRCEQLREAIADLERRRPA